MIHLVGCKTNCLRISMFLETKSLKHIERKNFWRHFNYLFCLGFASVFNFLRFKISRIRCFFKLQETETKPVVIFVWAMKTKFFDDLIFCFLVCGDHSSQKVGEMELGLKLHESFRETVVLETGIW